MSNTETSIDAARRVCLKAARDARHPHNTWPGDPPLDLAELPRVSSAYIAQHPVSETQVLHGRWLVPKPGCSYGVLTEQYTREHGREVVVGVWDNTRQMMEVQGEDQDRI